MAAVTSTPTPVSLPDSGENIESTLVSQIQEISGIFHIVSLSRQIEACQKLLRQIR